MTTGLNVAIKSVVLNPGEKWLVNNLSYNCTVFMAEAAAERDGGSVVNVEIPMPIKDEEEIVRFFVAVILRY